MTEQQRQSYTSHRQIVPLYHGVLLGLLLLTLIGAGVNLFESLGNSERLYSASLIFVLSVAVIMAAFFGRVFALKAQDRAIRAEEQLRHYILTGEAARPAADRSPDRRVEVRIRRGVRGAGHACRQRKSVGRCNQEGREGVAARHLPGVNADTRKRWPRTNSRIGGL